VCVLLKIGETKKIDDIEIRYACFHEELSYGTILYGTLVDESMFFTEDIYYYKGKNVSSLHYIEKL
jgi:hypothetical protein